MIKSRLHQMTKRALAAILPSRAFLVRGRGPAPRDLHGGQRPAISLTFDDGPHPEYTSRLLDDLGQAGLKATFFVIGELAQRHPAIVRRIEGEGHEIGNHTWSHREPREMSTRDFLREVEQTRSLIQDITGRDCPLVRPPKGELSIGKLWGLLIRRQSIILWNRDSRDYRMTSAAEMECWCAGYQPGHGDIVLLHDNRPHVSTAAALFTSLPQFKSADFVPITHWCERPPPVSGQPEKTVRARMAVGDGAD